jgi:two-component system cell cycle sensor histidine kinase/response regulator CckA
VDKKQKYEELKQSIKDMKPGDHLCLIYETEKEHRALLTPFMRQGLELGEKVLYIIDDHTQKEVLNYLRNDGMVVESYLKSGQLVISSVDETYLRGGIFDTDAMIELLRDETERSLEQGYSALRLTGEMTWSLKGKRGSERIIEYEARVNEIIPKSRCLAICQYDRRRFDPVMLSDVLATHPVAIIGTEIFDNFYYVPPEDFLRPDREIAKLDKRLKSLLELKQAGKALYESEEKYRRLFEEAPDGMFLAEAETGIIIDCNYEATRLVGRDRSELIGQHQKILHPPGQGDGKFSETFQKHLKGSEGQFLETQVITSTGEIKDVAIKANLLHAGNRILMQAIFRDITDRKRAEKSLKLFRALIERSNDAIEVVDPKTGHFLDVNEKGCANLGYSREELLSLKVTDIDPNMDLSSFTEVLMKELRKTGSLNQERYHLRKDGTTFPVEINLSYVQLDRDYIVNVARDITERKRAEETMRESEKRYRELFENSTDFVYTMDLKGHFTDVNKAAEDLTGYTKNELIGMSYKEYTPEDTHERIFKAFNRIFNEGKPLKDFPIEVITKDGTIRYFETCISPLRKGEEIIGFQGSSRDITARKRAEEAIQESEQKYRTILESIEEGYYETDIKGNFTFFNDSLCKILGYTGDELMGMNDRDFLPPEMVKNVYKTFNKIYQTGKPERIMGHDLIRKDGSKINVEASASLIRNPKDQPVGFRGIIRDITEAKRIEAELIQTKDFLQNIFNSSAEGITTTDLYGNIIYMSPRVKDILGYDQKELIGKKAYSLYSNGKEEAKAVMKVLTEEGELRNHEMKLVRKDGRLVDINLSASFLKDEKGGTIGTLGIYSDITEEKKLDAQLQQAQKMEAIGTLAGGIAHDFNNILTSIIGNAELILMTYGKDGYLREGIEEIKMAGERAASLTRQLLAFSRKQIIQPKILDLNTLLSGIKNMLVRLIGENIEILMVVEPALWQVEIDPNQMEQVILNLAVNARDAMPNGGKLTIQTANTYLDENYFSEQNIFESQPGSYVMVAVSDNGIGMDKETKEHIFEPFYSTKEKSKGTGLGLSTVYGIVKQNNGFIWVYSEPGHGSTFKIYLPRTKEGIKTEEKAQTPEKDLGGTETVLVVEDNVSILNFAQKVLRQYGYRVLTAKNGEDALRIGKEHEGPIDLLLTDVVMTTMNGKETAERLQLFYPQMKVIYMSGYTDDAIVHLGVLEPGLNFLQKPFSPEILVCKVREVLDK